MNNYEIIIIGAGHAGVEAANICGKLKKKTLLITNNINEISKISCNPSIGGVGKSQIVKEIDILGGIMGKAADKACTHVNILNKSKGLAVRSTRMQIDKYKYSNYIKEYLNKNNFLNILQGNVSNIVIKKNKVIGVLFEKDYFIKSKCVIITTGTFMDCKTYKGSDILNNCRDYEKYDKNLSYSLKKILPGVKKFKTGTPPRLDLRSINYDILNVQKNDYDYCCFSYLSKKKSKLIKNWETKTSKKTKKIILNNKYKSSFISGKIKSRGPRYCTSIEDKIINFPDKKFHNIFLEIESIYSNEIYVSGLSNSFDNVIQKKIIRSIKGLEKSVVIKFAYSIDYDYFNPKYLKKNLESKIVKNLFLAGQINGTSGYEEAACQGLYSGIFASKKISDNKFKISENNSYIYTLIKDIVKGIDEPYRMFTTRSKNRLKIREDNVLERLLKKSFKYSLINKNEYLKLEKIMKIKKKILIIFKKKKKIYKYIKDKGYSSKIFYNKKYLNKKYLNKNIDESYFNYVDSEIKYKDYIEKSKNQNIKLENFLDFVIPINTDFNKLKNVKKEFITKIINLRPRYFSEIKNIKGITHDCLINVRYFLLKNFKIFK
ncbi:tRNA uridine-5-carboxymethylaminomethyl(34) synthesis enzyme MnmG [Candidatus Vidania fulgoroideorum]